MVSVGSVKRFYLLLVLIGIDLICGHLILKSLDKSSPVFPMTKQQKFQLILRKWDILSIILMPIPSLLRLMIL